MAVGVAQDLPPGWDKKVLQFCDIMDGKVTEYEELLTHNRIWLERTKGIGLITGPQAVALGLSGPPLRGSGVPRDVRKDEHGVSPINQSRQSRLPASACGCADDQRIRTDAEGRDQSG